MLKEDRKAESWSSKDFAKPVGFLWLERLKGNDGRIISNLKRKLLFRVGDDEICNQVDLPIDPIQQPDFIISLFTVEPDENLEYEEKNIKRLSYLRIKATSKELELDTPKWY